jgi:AAA domain
MPPAATQQRSAPDPATPPDDVTGDREAKFLDAETAADLQSRAALSREANEILAWARERGQATTNAPAHVERRHAVRIPTPRSSLRSHLLVGDAILDVKPARSLVAGLFQQNSLVGCYGPPGSWKTWWMLHVALCVATSSDWQGSEVAGGPVLWVAGEDVTGIATRMRAWKARHGQLGSIGVIPHAVQLLDPAQLAELKELVEEFAPALIIVETLARCLVGADENSGKDMGRAIDALDQLRNVIGSTVAVVHHSGKDRERGLRGWSGLLGAMDTTVECERTRSGLTTVIKKQKNASDGAVSRYVLEPEGDSAVLVESTDQPERFRPTYLMGQISKFLAEQAIPISQNGVLQAVKGDSNAKRTALSVLTDEGFIRRTEGSNRSLLLEHVMLFEDSK